MYEKGNEPEKAFASYKKSFDYLLRKKLWGRLQNLVPRLLSHSFKTGQAEDLIENIPTLVSYASDQDSLGYLLIYCMKYQALYVEKILSRFKNISNIKPHWCFIIGKVQTQNKLAILQNLEVDFIEQQSDEVIAIIDLCRNLDLHILEEVFVYQADSIKQVVVNQNNESQWKDYGLYINADSKSA